MAAARRGDWQVVLTPERPVPRDWLEPLTGKRVLCLACGGGQQGPVLAAAGAEVTVLDNSPAQLAQDRLVAEREGLAVRCVEGDMRDLSAFADGAFELVFHPVSNCFIDEVRPVWREAFRVLAPGGSLLAGFCNPMLFCFDDALRKRGTFRLAHPQPYSDVDSLSPEQRARFEREGEPLEFGHTLDDQIGGQIDAGFVLAGFYEDGKGWTEARSLATFFPPTMATRALKPRG